MTIEQLSGRVELLRAGSETWVRAERLDAVCYGDSIRTRSDGEVTWTTWDGVEVRLSRRGHAKFLPPEAEKRSITELVKGWLYLLSQDSRELAIRTLHANGGPEGTEFVVNVDDNGTAFGTLDGAVLVSNSEGVRRVTAGESLRVAPDGVIGRPESAGPELLPWAYFPRIVAGPLPLPDAEPTSANDADFLVRRAAARLALGAVAEAMSDLDRAAVLDAGDARVDALRAIIAHVAGDQAQAEAFVASALRANRDSVEALLASSHVQEGSDAASRDALAAAVADAQHARNLAPTNGLAWIRLAEAYLGAKRYRNSLDAALEAASLAPDSPEAYTVLGFALYAQRQLDDALAAFEQAMELGSMSPYTWHGAALVMWQQGRREEAREAAEVGLILDPANVDTRSALARFYDAEARHMLSGEQLTLAALLTPSDPTPLLLRSYMDQMEANPISALFEYRSATRRNAGRPPTRATFSLDRDLGTEDFGVARVFIDTDTIALGNEVVRKQLADDLLSPSAHQASADLATHEPFSQAVVVNDSVIHTLLTSSIESSASLQRDQQFSSAVREMTPRILTTPDVDVPLSENGAEGSVSAFGGNRGNEGVGAALAFRAERFAIGLNAFNNRSGGWRPNQDSEEQGRSLRFKLARDPGTSVVLDVISFEAERGDLASKFFPATHGDSFRVTEENNAFRLGWRRPIAAVGRGRPEIEATLLVFWVLNDYEYAVDSEFLRIGGSGTEHTLAARYVFRTPKYTLDFGASVDLSTTDQEVTGAPLTTFDDRQRALYAYLDRKLTDSLTLTLGINVDDRRGDRGLDGGQTNGKAAIVWEASDRTTLRFAYAETPPPPVASSSRSNGHPDLERSRIAGFPQFVYPNTDRTRTRWAGADHEFTERVFGGISYRERTLSRPLLFNGVDPLFLEIYERITSTHLYWLPSNTLSIAAIHERDRYRAPAGDFAEFSTSRTTLDFNLFMGGGRSASIRVARVHQDGTFVLPGSGMEYAPGHSAFTIFDAGMTFRLSNRRTIFDLRGNNLTDKRIHYQEPEFDYTTMAPARTISVSLRQLFR